MSKSEALQFLLTVRWAVIFSLTSRSSTIANAAMNKRISRPVVEDKVKIWHKTFFFFSKKLGKCLSSTKYLFNSLSLFFLNNYCIFNQKGLDQDRKFLWEADALSYKHKKWWHGICDNKANWASEMRDWWKADKVGQWYLTPSAYDRLLSELSLVHCANTISSVDFLKSQNGWTRPAFKKDIIYMHT